MKVLGIIAEYNPFHLGHLYHLQESKKLVNPDYTICILGSHFLQRGEPSLVDKWARCNMALKAGIDLVIELPVAFSCRSALWFATGSIYSLNSTGLVTHLAFGAENTDLEGLSIIAKYLNKEVQIYRQLLEKYLLEGYSFPKARNLALNKSLKNKVKLETLTSLNNPNNILAISYLQILETLNSQINPVIIKRKGNYHSKIAKENLASATAIRKLIKERKPWQNLVPDFSRAILAKEFSLGKGPVFFDDFAENILAIIRRSTAEELRAIIEVREGIENRLIKLAQETGNIKNLIDNLKTKRYTYTRLQRLLTHIYLNFKASPNFDYPQYLRVLGFNDKGKQLLKLMKDKSSLPIITKFAKIYKAGPDFIDMLNLEIRASDLYVLAYPQKEQRIGRQDFYKSPLVLF